MSTRTELAYISRADRFVSSLAKKSTNDWVVGNIFKTRVVRAAEILNKAPFRYS